MYKVAVVTICLNEPYWPYLGRMIDSARKFFLKGHQVDYLTWSDMPNVPEGIKSFPTQPFTWPIPTLKRYHLFLQQEELLKEYDFIYYLDADMEVTSRVGEEIFGNLMAAPHPGYATSRKFIPPYEPDKDSKAFIPRLGYVSEVNGKKRFNPFYAAGGFQGGRADAFIKAMKQMREWIDEDFMNNKVPIWNDESVWNKYLFDECQKGTDITYLTPSYVYPDSLINQYYVNLWGRNYVPKIVTLTKPFSLNQEAGVQLMNTI